jgi:hypothetical protein
MGEISRCWMKALDEHNEWQVKPMVEGWIQQNTIIAKVSLY